MAKMTVQQVEALKAKDVVYKRNVDTGLQIRVAVNGVKAWVVQYVVGGKQREYRLPKPWGTSSDDGHLSLKDARTEAEMIRALARQGIDFQVRLEQERLAEVERRSEEKAAENLRREQEQTENLTVKDLFSVWLADGVRRKDGNTELLRSFKADVLPVIGSKPVKDLTEHDIRGVLRALVNRGVNRAAVVLRNNLTQMFAWAEKRQPWRRLLINGDPMDLIEIDKIVSPGYDLRNERDRILSADEIRELHDIFIRMGADYLDAPNKRNTTRPVEQTTQRAIWIMLSTMCRVGELSMARWEHVDLETGRWFIPKENVKGNLENLEVFLSSFALDQFRQLHKTTGHSEWCFPASLKEGHVCVKSISKQVGDRQTMFKKGKDGNSRQPLKHRRHDNTLVLGGGNNGEWTPHDLRRTGATMMQSLGVSLVVIDRCQNHVLPGSKVRRHYMLHEYAEEKREAWVLLGNRISLIINSADNVVMLRKA